MNSYNALHFKACPRRAKQELVEHGIIILFVHFTHSLVLTQEQFSTVIAAIGEGLIPVPQQPKTLLKIWMNFTHYLLNSTILSDISVLKHSRITSQ